MFFLGSFTPVVGVWHLLLPFLRSFSVRIERTCSHPCRTTLGPLFSAKCGRVFYFAAFSGSFSSRFSQACLVFRALVIPFRCCGSVARSFSRAFVAILVFAFQRFLANSRVARFPVSGFRCKQIFLVFTFFDGLQSSMCIGFLLRVDLL